jgi:ABC-type bacteriocin/lantibiotic exporter with double-glycine peptidase domain
MQPILEGVPRLVRPYEPVVRTIPFVRQLEWADGCAAALAMVLGFHGKHVALDRVRSAFAVSRASVTARAILDAAGQFGFTGRGVQVTLDQLADLPRATILHWELEHHVVLDRVIGDRVRIVDPAIGVRDVPWDEVTRCFRGVALELRPRTDFVREQRTNQQAARSYLRGLFAERAVFTRVVVVSLIMRLFALVLPLVTGLVVDWAVPRSDLSMLWVVLGAVLGVVGVQAVCTIMRAQLFLALRTKLDGQMTVGFLDHMMALPVGFFQRRSAGDLMMRVNTNATIREVVTSQSLAAVIDGLFVAVYAIVILAVNAQLGLLASGFAAIVIVVWYRVRPKLARALAVDIERQAKAQGYLVQLLAGVETVKSAGAEATVVERYANLYADCLEISVRRGRLAAKLDAFYSSLATLAPMVMLAVGAHAVITGALSLGTMLAMSSLAVSLFGPLTGLAQSLMQLQGLKIYTQRMDDVRRTAPEQDPDVVLEAPVLAGGVSLHNVSLRHGDGPFVVNDVTLDIAPGTSVALVGASGSGKTSLLNLIAGIVTPTTGSVKFDGRSLAELDLRAVRQQIGIVPQHPYIFGGTVRDNIALTVPHADAERVQQAAAVAALDGDMAQLPLGLDTPVSDGGASLSGGQRQRIALARAVLHEPSLLLLDEATSALDAATEARITASLARLRATRVTVAHRLSTVARADQIVVLDRGRIAEIGTHASLLARRGTYYHLVAAEGGVASPDLETLHAQTAARHPPYLVSTKRALP